MQNGEIHFMKHDHEIIYTETYVQMSVALHCVHLGFQKCCCCSKYFVTHYCELSLEPVYTPQSIFQQTLG